MLCAVSSALPAPAIRTLEKRFPLLLLPPDDSLPPPIRCHPDSILTRIGNAAVLPRSYGNAHPEIVRLIGEAGYRTVLSDAPREDQYPLDVSLNAAAGRDFLVCRTDSAAPELLSLAREGGIRIVPVKQGYAGCSCLVTDAAILTSDRGIFRSLTENRIPVRFFSGSGILLPGYDCGFLGGCGGFCGGVLYFFGRTESLPCGGALREFAREAGYAVCELIDGPLTDFGGMMFF